MNNLFVTVNTGKINSNTTISICKQDVIVFDLHSAVVGDCVRLSNSNEPWPHKKSHFEPMYTEPLSQCGDFCDKNGLVMSLGYLKELHQRL